MTHSLQIPSKTTIKRQQLLPCNEMTGHILPTRNTFVGTHFDVYRPLNWPWGVSAKGVSVQERSAGGLSAPVDASIHPSPL